MTRNTISGVGNQNAHHAAGRAPAVREKLRRLWLFIRDNELTGLDGTFF